MKDKTLFDKFKTIVITTAYQKRENTSRALSKN